MVHLSPAGCAHYLSLLLACPVLSLFAAAVCPKLTRSPAHPPTCPQFAVGMFSYVAPRASLPFRLALGPVHKFAGYATWLCGLGALAVSGTQHHVTS